MIHQKYNLKIQPMTTQMQNNEWDYYSFPKYKNHTLENTFDYSDDRIGDYAQNLIIDSSMLTYNDNNLTSIASLANEYFHNASSLEIWSDEQNSVISSENEWDLRQIKTKINIDAGGSHKAFPSYSSK